MPTNKQVCKNGVNAFATPVTNDMSEPVSLLSYLESQGLTIDNIKKGTKATPNAEILIQRPRDISELPQETHRMIARVILNYMGIQCHYGEPGCSISNHLSKENNLAFDTYIFSKVIITDDVVMVPMGFQQIGLMNLSANTHHVLRQLFSILRGITFSRMKFPNIKVTRFYKMFQIPPENVGYTFFLINLSDDIHQIEQPVTFSNNTLTTRFCETKYIHNLDDVRFAPTINERIESW